MLLTCGDHVICVPPFPSIYCKEKYVRRCKSNWLCQWGLWWRSICKSWRGSYLSSSMFQWTVCQRATLDSFEIPLLPSDTIFPPKLQSSYSGPWKRYLAVRKATAQTDWFQSLINLEARSMSMSESPVVFFTVHTRPAQFLSQNIHMIILEDEGSLGKL